MSRISLIACIFFTALLTVSGISHAAPIHYTATGYATTHTGVLLPITGSMVIDDQTRSWTGALTKGELKELHEWTGIDVYQYFIENFTFSVGNYTMSGTGALYMPLYRWPTLDDFGAGDLMWFLRGDETSQWDNWTGENFHFIDSNWDQVSYKEYMTLPDIISLTALMYFQDDPIFPQSAWPFNLWLVRQNYPVPEPGTLLLLGSGLAGLALYRRRMNKV